MMTDRELSDIGLSGPVRQRFSIRPLPPTVPAAEATLPTDGSGPFCFW